jgi:hypothetical protein
MLKAITLFAFSLMVFQTQASVKEIYLPTLECQGNTFKDVSVNYDDARTNREDITISLICQRLRSKLVKQTVVSDLSRFIVDKMAPEQVDKIAPRANDFFRIVLFKPSILGREKFDFNELNFEDIMERLRVQKFMKLRTFTPDPENMNVVAFHKEGAAFINSYKMERNECSMINTLVHEYTHYLGFGHGDNSPVGKENSIPYYFGNRAQELCEAGVI